MLTEHHHTGRCRWNVDDARWICADASTDPDTVHDRALVDVRDMIVVHTALLREFRLAPVAVRRSPVGDHRQARRVAAHLRFVGDLLHHHHEGEDALLWPKLRGRTPPSAGPILDAAEGQHREIDAALSAVTGAREQWADKPDDRHRDLLASRLDELYALLSEHLDLEERALLPLAAGALTTEEWQAIGEAAVSALPKPALALAFGMFAYEGDTAVLRDMLAAAPAVPRAILPRIAPRLYARRARRVYGTTRP